MKKLLVVMLLAFSFIGHAHAAVVYPPPLVYGPPSTGPAFFPFAGAVTGAIAIEILNAEGVPFPACSEGWQMGTPQNGTKCYSEYPIDVHHDGV